jgi:hypothetical protein
MSPLAHPYTAFQGRRAASKPRTKRGFYCPNFVSHARIIKTCFEKGPRHKRLNISQIAMTALRTNTQLGI